MDSFPSSWIIGIGSADAAAAPAPPPPLRKLSPPHTHQYLHGDDIYPPRQKLSPPPHPPSPRTHQYHHGDDIYPPQRKLSPPPHPPPSLRTHQYHHGVDIYPPLPFRKRRRRSSSLFSLGGDDTIHPVPSTVRAAYTPITMRAGCCCCEDIYPKHLLPPSSSGYYRDLLSTITKPLPQQSPFTSAGATPQQQYPTYFPSTWFLSAQLDGISAVSFQQQHTRTCPHVHSAAQRLPPVSPLRPGSPLRQVSPHLLASIETCPPPSPVVLPRPQRSVTAYQHTHDKEGASGGRGRRRRRADSVAERHQTNAQQHHHLPETMDVDDAMMRELKGSPSRKEEIDRWIQSLSHPLPWSGGGPGSLHSGTNNSALWWAREAHPSELSEVSDDSGLGDVPHKGLEVPDTYSVYTMPTYARSMAK